MRTRVVIIGVGFVGDAIYRSLSEHSISSELVAIDPAQGFNTPYSEIKDFDAAFVCVPSPQLEDGSADTSILESVLKELDNVDFTGVIISKVTAPPGKYQELQKTYKNLIHAPEFLTAANSYADYEQGTFAIIGGSVAAYRNEAERIIRISQPKLNYVVHCAIGEASLAKYVINSFLATKVVFMNEMAELAETNGIDWNVVSAAVTKDIRIGNSHMKVPGSDGQYGFGGMCFPKDTNALLRYAGQTGCNLDVLNAAVEKNTSLRLKKPK